MSSHTSVDDTAARPSLELEHIMAPALASRHARVRGFLHRLAANPPQVLLMEGGTVEERAAMSFYWAALLNCTLNESEGPRPCLACSACAQMIACRHRDMFFLDGREESIKIDDVRAVRGVLGEPPRDNGQRMVILCEAQSLGVEAANALLKSLEEPRPGTSFVLLAPQRERLLPTLVSRSWVLTLAWPESHGADASSDPLEVQAAEWGDALAEFARTGTGWFQRTASKSSLDNGVAQRVVVYCQRELVSAITGNVHSELARLFAGVDSLVHRRVDEVLAECQESLVYNVNPAIVMDWLATRVALLCSARR